MMPSLTAYLTPRAPNVWGYDSVTLQRNGITFNNEFGFGFGSWQWLPNRVRCRRGLCWIWLSALRPHEVSGACGAAGGDEQSIVNVIQRFSQLLSDQGAIREFEINPILAFASGVGVVDGRMRIRIGRSGAMT